MNEQVSTTRETVYLVMAVWSWSLLQFCFILTTNKQMPRILDEHEFEELIIGEINCGGSGTSSSKRKKRLKASLKQNGKARNGSTRNGLTLTVTRPPPRDEKALSAAVDLFDAELEVESVTHGRRCCECFCCYNEIWGMAAAMMFQDGPFLITRLIILLHYRVFTHMNIFFTLKNVIVILLLLNRIRVVVHDERSRWRDEYARVLDQRRRHVEEKRRLMGLPPV